ncbi:tetratricopeptide repeat protein [Stenotrophomonas maltophilia]|uniref:tetratricopeptide repeat protein n=1 Tax=Stenotrophomonas maltophilia TaxID=40324 RepID=UPI001F2BB292|nr:hypothetical protein [Stenotrophomonas maltophilia]MCF3527066.1 hypothetical protein [Stenotrophomonas maltophilia]MCF3555808.1 hypothetical protein [Stenotrophomonas maltophilia]
MTKSTSMVNGISGTEATSSKRGYYYQDIVTAVAWCRLRAGEELYVEVAEDYAVAGCGNVEVTQVKDLESSLTLVSGAEYIERVLKIFKENVGRAMSFVYLTTSRVAIEKSPDLRPEGIAGIEYWRDVQAGVRPPDPLIKSLKALPNKGALLQNFLDNRSDEEVINQIIMRITWATRAPESDFLKSELCDRVAEIAYQECKLEATEGRRLWPAVIDAVTSASTSANPRMRILSYKSLRDLLREESTVTLTKRKYERLLGDAEFAKNPPVGQVDKDIRDRIDYIQKTRFLTESAADDLARALGKDVAEGGACQIGDQKLRALALSWCARALLEIDSSLAASMLDDSVRLFVIPEQILVQSLLLAKSDKHAALRLISSDLSDAAGTVRYGIHRQEGAEFALDYLIKADVQVCDLDCHGMLIVLFDLLRSEKWSEAIGWFERVPESALNAYPALQWGGANALLAWATADVARGSSLSGPPIADEVPLRDDLTAIEARRRAVDLFQSFRQAALGWGLEKTAELALEYALWLKLEDRLAQSSATAEVSRLWFESDHASRWIPLVIRAGLEVDKRALSERIDRNFVRYGSLSLDDARARMALLISMPAEEWIDSWQEIRNAVSFHFAEAFLEHIEVQGLLHAGRVDDAKSALAKASNLPEAARTRFEIELGESNEGAIQEYREIVERDGTPASLHNLVRALVRRGNLRDAAAFALQMYEKTREHESAEEYVRIARRQGEWAGVLAFLDGHKFLLEQSEVLARMYVDALLRHGRWKDAEDIAESYMELGAEKLDFSLQVSINSGAWEDVGRLLENSFAESDISEKELIRLASISTSIGNVALAKRMVRRATERSPIDPNIAWSAYMVAVKGNWERDPEVREWVNIGIASADTEGSSVQSATLSDLMKLAPRLKEQSEALEKGVASGEMFLALAATQVNRPLVSIIVGSAISNESEPEFRSLSPVPLYAGIARKDIESRIRSVALDVTAILTLVRLGLLQRILEFFETIYVPHSIGVWLFSEASRVRFHQPGRIVEARKLLHAIARKELRIMDATAGFSQLVKNEVGVDLAQLIHVCQFDREAGKDAFVVRPAPLHRVGSLLEENADVSSFSQILRSVSQLVKSLHFYGGISDREYDDAVSYLDRVDHGWASDELIPLGSTIYLDDLSINYLQYLDLIKPLSDARFDLVMHSDVHAQAVSLNSLEETNDKLGVAVEEIRKFYFDGQARDIVRPLPMPDRDLKTGGEEHETLFEATPVSLLSQMFARAQGVEAIIFDDRSMNRHQNFSYPDGVVAPIFSTLDVIDWMLAAGVIEGREWLRGRTTLRRSGFIFIPLKFHELRSALDTSSVHSGELIESLAARAIRENVLLAQASSMLRIPDEGYWISSCGQEVFRAVTDLWNCDGPESAISVKADWLLGLSRLDGYADRMLGGDEDTRWINFDALHFVRLVINPDVDESRRVAYNAWLESKYLTDMALGRPRVFESLCAMVRRNILDLSAATGGDDDLRLTDEVRQAAVAIIRKDLINGLPSSVREAVLENCEVLESLGLRQDTVIGVNLAGSPSFLAEDLYSAAQRIYASGEEQAVEDQSGNNWEIRLGVEGVVECIDVVGERVFKVAHSPLVSNDVSSRIEYAERYAKEVGVSLAGVSSWLTVLMDRPLRVGELPMLERDFQNCPKWLMGRFSEALKDGSISGEDLAPVSRDYYHRLVGVWGGERTIREFSDKFKHVIDIPGYPLGALICSSHSSLAPTEYIRTADARLLQDEIAQLLGSADLWSLVGLIEGLAARPDAFTDLLEMTSSALDCFVIAVRDQIRLEVTSGLASMICSRLILSGVWTDVPVFWRRFAAIAQAGLVERVLLSSSADLSDFAKWVSGSLSIFQIGCLAELDLEPRWNGFMLNPKQLQQELVGRVLFALEPRKADLESVGLAVRIFADNSESLASIRSFFFSVLPGPLEGGEDCISLLPEQFVRLLETNMNDADQSIMNRVAMASQFACIGRLPDGLLSRLTEAVGELNKTDLASEAGDGLSSLCMTLSLAAAANRDVSLSEAVQRLVLGQSDFPFALRVLSGLTACAAESDRVRWSAAVGLVISNCTAMVKSSQDADYLLYVVRAICDVQSDLRRVVSKSYAQLSAMSRRLL